MQVRALFRRFQPGILLLFFAQLVPIFSDASELPIHLAPNASTLRRGQLSWEPYAGANPLAQGSFLMNSLSVGVSENFQLGTVPIFYSANGSSLKIINFGAKYKLHEKDRLMVSSGLFYLGFRMKGEAGSYRFDNQIEIFQPSLHLNYKFNEHWDALYSVSSGILRTSGKSTTTQGEDSYGPLMIYGKFDHYLDFRYAATPTNYWIMGASSSHPAFAGIGMETSASVGAGLSHGWLLKGRWISSLNLGFHFLNNGESRTLVGMSF